MGIMDHKQSVSESELESSGSEHGPLAISWRNDESYESDETRPRFGLVRSLAPWKDESSQMQKTTAVLAC
jgi:hypothetical protein